VRLPHALGEPCAEGTLSKDRVHAVGERADLAYAVAARNADEHGLVVATRQELDLAAAHEVGEVADDVGAVRFEPVEEGAGEVKARLHLRMAVERGHERRVGALGHLLED